METAPLKSFATWARTSLIREVTARIAVVLAPASPERVEQPKAVEALEKAVTAAGEGDKGKAAVADKVAYTWFNRIIALRFMDASGYTSVGVVSPQAGVETGQPEILAEAKRGNFETDVVGGKTRETVTALLNGTHRSDDAQGEAYALLLADYCRYWNRAMPFMFEREGDFTELLIPANLLAEDSLPSRAVKVLTKDVCQDVEVIGWLYQFYISERKDEVFAGFKKNKKAGADEIPAATQLFTPHWIVRYLVENSLGRLWMLNHPTSRLVDQMQYYIAPVEEETDFLKIARPEELKVVDPACGSGHMLTYAFDLLYAIYEEEGYAPAEIPSLILTNNLYGIEIDPRAGALAAFALTMKARAKQRTFFNRQVEPNVCVLDPISFTPDEIDFLLTRGGDKHAEAAFWNQFEHADTFGSLIQPDPGLTVQLADHLTTLDDDGDILRADALDWAQRVIDQATYLTGAYAVVIANPPYMGSKQMNALLSQFMKHEYPDGKSDLFAAFFYRTLHFVARGGQLGFMSPFVWMFISSYQKLRERFTQGETITSLIQLEYSGFDGATVPICTFTLQRGHKELRAAYVRLSDFVGASQQADRALEIIQAGVAKERGERVLLPGMAAHFYRAAASDFMAIPGWPIVYWLSEKMRAAFSSGTPLGEISAPLVGLRTGDNNRFMRQWWEVSNDRSAFACESLQAAEATGAMWFPYNKGGAFRRWYGNHEFVVNWEQDGKEIEEGLAERYPYLVSAGKTLVRGQGRDRYFSPSVSWSDISSGAPSFRSFPKGFIHGNKGNSLFGASLLLVRLLGVMNAPCATVILEALTPTMTASVGDVGKTPIPDALADLPASGIQALVATARSDWDDSETSWNFSSNPLVAVAQMSRPETS